MTPKIHQEKKQKSMCSEGIKNNQSSTFPSTLLGEKGYHCS